MGSLIAAQIAAYEADKGRRIPFLVLIGCPISQEFLDQLRTNKNIGSVVVIDLTEHSDPIYAGMSSVELVESVVTLIAQFSAYDGTGHFYYALDDEVGKQRRRELAGMLWERGVR